MIRRIAAVLVVIPLIALTALLISRQGGEAGPSPLVVDSNSGGGPRSRP